MNARNNGRVMVDVSDFEQKQTCTNQNVKQDRTAQTIKVAQMVKTSPCANTVSGVTGGVFCGAMLLWGGWRSGETYKAAGVVLLLIIVVLIGGHIGVSLTDAVRRRIGTRIINKIYDNKKTMRFEQHMLSRLFEPWALLNILSYNSGAFRALCDGKLSHVSYDVATKIIEGHLRDNPDDYSVLRNAFEKSFIPEHIREKYERNIVGNKLTHTR